MIRFDIWLISGWIEEKKITDGISTNTQFRIFCYGGLPGKISAMGILGFDAKAYNGKDGFVTYFC